MTTFTVQAVYHKGALRPKKKLDLPEDALVQVQVTQLAPASTGFAALKGIWSHLSDQEVDIQKAQSSEFKRAAHGLAAMKIELLNLHGHSEAFLRTAAKLEQFVYSAKINCVYQHP